MLKIGIDTRLLEKKITGVGRFLISILKELPHYDKKNEYFLFSYKNNFNSNNFFININTDSFLKFLPEKLYSFLWLNFILPRYLTKNKIDLFFSVNHLIPFIKKKVRKDIVVVHDVFYKIKKEYHSYLYRKYLEFVFPISLKRSEVIIAISKSSKNDLIKYCGVKSDKIKVLYQFADKKFKSIDILDLEKKQLLKEYNLTEKFALYVGVIENRKNIVGILKIADTIQQRNRSEKILLIGKQGNGFSRIINEINKRKVNIVYVEYVSDEILIKLYNLASVFLFPSLYEGFGLPPLEAMNCGTPVLASNNSSLPEVIGNGGLLFDHNDYKAYADSMEKLFDDNNFYLEMKQKALEQAKQFTPEKTIQQLISIFSYR